MTKFLVDRMLGQTAKWLRLLGVDAEYAPKGEDEKLLEIAREEERVIVTRDRELGREDKVFLVEKSSAEEIVSKIILEYDVSLDPMSRCSKCNTEVIKEDQKVVKDQVPERVYERNEEFWYCPECDQYYWEGSHWEDIMSRIESITRCKSN